MRKREIFETFLRELVKRGMEVYFDTEGLMPKSNREQVEEEERAPRDEGGARRVRRVGGGRMPAAAILHKDGTCFGANLHLARYRRTPVDGVIRSWRHIPGRLFPVNGLAVRHVNGLFTVNERVVVNLESERFGHVALVMVGASNVGRITLSFPHDNDG